MMQSNRLIIGQKYKVILSNKTIEDIITWIPDNPHVDKRLSGHADLSVFCHRGELIALKGLESYLDSGNCIFIDENIGNLYPDDVKFNACSIGNTVFLNEKYVSQQILQYLIAKGSSIVHVNQGYCKCSILVLNSNSIITSDPSIYEAASKCNLNVLRIHNGHISLDGFDYGFIGGAGFMIDDCNLFFTGTIDDHPDKDAIKSFCMNLGISIDYLTKNPAFDVGGVIIAE